MAKTTFSLDRVTISASAALAFICACVSHEAIGHGGTCLALGRHITGLSSVYFRCSTGDALTDAAGPLMNLAVGAALWLVLRSGRVASVHGRLFLALSMAYNLFWGAGQVLLNAVTNTGDAAFALRELALAPLFAWRCGLAAVAFALYVLSVRAVARSLPRGVPVLLPYVVAGALACLATLCAAGGVTVAIFEEGVKEGFGTGIGLLLAGWTRRSARDLGEPVVKDEEVVGRSIRWVLASAVITLVFLLTMGRGFLSK